MCLTTSQQTPDVAKEDITCYKVVEKEYRGKRWYTPFQYYYFLFGRVLKCKNFGERIDNAHIVGGFHSFVSSDDAYTCGLGIRNVGSKKQAIVECVIPEGTKYYPGIFRAHCGYQFPSFCSEKIIYKKIISKRSIASIPHKLDVFISRLFTRKS